MSAFPSTWPSAQAALRSDVLRKIGPYCVVAIIAALYVFPFMRVMSAAPDEGIYLYASQRVADGAIPGRDFLQENPPGAFYWLAWWFRLFGASIVTARVVLLLTAVATVVVVFHLARRIGTSGLYTASFVLITSVPFMPINSPHYDSNLFVLLAFAVFLAGLDRMGRGSPKRWPFVVAGLLAGWVSCILYQKGFLFLTAFVVTMLIIHRKRGARPVVLMVVSYATAVIVELVPYALWGALPDLFFSTVKMPLSGYQGLNQVMYGFPIWTAWFPALLSQFKANSSVFIALPLLVATSLPFLLILLLPLAVGILGYVWRSRMFAPPLLPYWLAGGAMWLSELHRRDLNHLRNGSIILAVLFFIICERYGTRALKRVALAVTLGTLLMGITILNGAMYMRHPLVTRRGTLLAERKDAVLEFLLSHTRPGDYAFIYPYSPIYYFLADLRNPTKIAAWVDQRDNPLIAQAVRDLETKKPQYVVADTRLLGDGMRSMFPAYHPPPPQDRVIDRYVAAHYHEIGFADGFRFLERNSG